MQQILVAILKNLDWFCGGYLQMPDHGPRILSSVHLPWKYVGEGLVYTGQGS